MDHKVHPLQKIRTEDHQMLAKTTCDSQHYYMVLVLVEVLDL